VKSAEKLRQRVSTRTGRGDAPAAVTELGDLAYELIRSVGALLAASIVNVSVIALEALGVTVHAGDVRSREWLKRPSPTLRRT
jgi:hypothetical protein